MPNGTRASNFSKPPVRFLIQSDTSFVLLSDVLGLSSLVDMINNRPEGTSSSVLGPFHISGSPTLAVGGDMKRHYEGPVLLVEGVVKRPDGTPIPGATLDIWQTAPNGMYSSQDPDQDTYSFHGLQTVGRRRALCLHDGPAC